MLSDVVEVELLGDHRVRLRFDDGLEGDLDLSTLIVFEGVFASLRDPREFAKLELNDELGTIVWPNGADLDPLVLYSLISRQPIELAVER